MPELRLTALLMLLERGLLSELNMNVLFLSEECQNFKVNTVRYSHSNTVYCEIVKNHNMITYLSRFPDFCSEF